MNSDLERLASDYRRFCFEGDGDDNAHAAFLAMVELIRDAPDQAWQVVVELLKLADTLNQLSFLGAGPIEDLLRLHPDVVLPLLSTAAETDDHLRRALVAVSSTALVPDVAAEVKRLKSAVTPN